MMETIFKTNGVLHQNLPCYKVRENQIAFAQRTHQAMLHAQTFIAEAPTGIGKTWGYLVPALLTGKKTILSTHTKVLQNQIFEKDLPFLCAVLPVSAEIALLKGKENYLCLSRFLQTIADFWNQSVFQELTHLIEDHPSFSGDRADCPEMALSVWEKINVQTESCTWNDCPEFKNGQCYLHQARKKAEKADILVVNHALFFSFITQTSLFQNAQVIIFDEAHHIPEAMAQAFSQIFDCQKFNHLLDILQTMHKMPHYEKWKGKLLSLQKTLHSFMHHLFESKGNMNKSAWEDCAQNPFFSSSFDQLVQQSMVLSKLPQKEELDSLSAPDQQRYENIQVAIAEQLNALYSVMHAKEDKARFVEFAKRNAFLVERPLDISKIADELWHRLDQSFIFTSATLSIGGDFSYFCNHLKLQNAQTYSFSSPFSYPDHARIYVPHSLPNPNEKTHPQAVLHAALPLILNSPGGVFILCTSKKACQTMHAILSEVLMPHPHFLLLKQGDAAPSQLLKQFKAHGRAILVATRTFWEGVDVPGEALSLVIIDKLPFPALGDPVVHAKNNYLTQQNQNPFWCHLLPEAAMILKQGAGRLIRNETDYGILMLGDNRFLKKAYRHFVLKTLPPMPLICNEQEALDFFKHPPFKLNSSQ